MRVIVDTSVLIRNLYSSAPASTASGAFVAAALARSFTLILIDGVVDELERTVRERPDLAARISGVDLVDLVAALRAVAEPTPRLREPYPEVCRDRKDDFLIAHAVLSDADWLVTWDKDLLDLGQIDGLTIADPPRFLAALRDAGLL